MSLTRGFLNGMGLTADQVSAIIEAHTETVDSLKAQRDNYKTEADKVAELTDKLTKAEDKLKGIGDDSEWKTKYEEEHGAFEAYKAEQTEAETTRVKTEAYKSALKQAGISDKAIDLILDGSKAREAIKALELEDGKIKDADTLVEGLKTDYSGFITSSNTEGAKTQTPPIGSGAVGKKTREEILQIKDATERQAAIAENPEAFGI